MNKMKYVLNSEDYSFAIIPEHMAHSDVSGYWDCAGFVQFYEESGKVKVHCSGKSVSLGLKSRKEEDAYIIQRQISPEF